MRRIVLFGSLVLAIMLVWHIPNAYGQGSVHNPLGRALFTINLPYEIDAAGVTIPPGEYVIRDMGVKSQNLLSISCRDEFESIALLHTVRRQLVAGRQDTKYPKLVFDEENPAKPVLREIVVPGLDDYIVVAAVATDEVNSDCVMQTVQTSELKVTTKVVEEEKPVVETPPQPAPEPTPAPEVKQPEPQPQPEVAPPPVKERKRVRKD
ncbi:MAG: hypothetical protein AB1489_13650 [Acidobacteriota bacterium]